MTVYVNSVSDMDTLVRDHPCAEGPDAGLTSTLQYDVTPER